MRKTKLLLTLAAIAVASSAFAWPGEPPPPPPPPPPELNDCSPGFWKNHQELWVGIACTGTICDGILADLKSRGKGSGELRHAAADDLNSWADGAIGYKVCMD
jgi:hypothetical protein